jgi:hypothetical protein
MSGARVTYSTHISHSGASRIPSGEMTSLADQQQLARQRRRFYRHILLPELPAADLHIRRSRRRPGPPPSAYLHRSGDASGSVVAAFTVCGRASLCPVALIAAGSCERAGRVRGAKRPPSGAEGALDPAARERIMAGGGKGADLRRDRRFRVCWRGAFLAGTGGDLLHDGTGAARGQPGLPRPAGACRAWRSGKSACPGSCRTA